MMGGEAKEEKVTTIKTTLVAWYTTDVPVSNGPK